MLWHREAQRTESNTGIDLIAFRMRLHRQLPVVQNVTYVPRHRDCAKTQFQWRAERCEAKLYSLWRVYSLGLSDQIYWYLLRYGGLLNYTVFVWSNWFINIHCPIYSYITILPSVILLLWLNGKHDSSSIFVEYLKTTGGGVGGIHGGSIQIKILVSLSFVERK